MARENVKVRLSNPLPAKYAVRLGLKNQDYPVDEVLELHPDRARDLEGAGYVSARIEGKAEKKVPETESSTVPAQRTSPETEKKKA